VWLTRASLFTGNTRPGGEAYRGEYSRVLPNLLAPTPLTTKSCRLGEATILNGRIFVSCVYLFLCHFELYNQDILCPKWHGLKIKKKRAIRDNLDFEYTDKPLMDLSSEMEFRLHLYQQKPEGEQSCRYELKFRKVPQYSSHKIPSSTKRGRNPEFWTLSECLIAS
jgi:hypothetical protein